MWCVLTTQFLSFSLSLSFLIYSLLFAFDPYRGDPPRSPYLKYQPSHSLFFYIFFFWTPEAEGWVNYKAQFMTFTLYYHLYLKGLFIPHLNCWVLFINIIIVVQLLSHVWFFATSWTAADKASLSFTISQSLRTLNPLSQWCHPAISSSVAPFSCPRFFPASGSGLF